ncbi:SNF2 family N-terminal domain containing protein [Babesia divergens]|uniref:SNF2 family N-terminal domain containing protein n=1 Tax=Babesia divergens TaxID=32595 RepID=A0AAD9G707_BABDI|nr:SNF2 family N-terminal domain containing protein [Babesia divergens]
MVTTDSFLLVGGRNRSNIIEDASIDDLESFALKQDETQSPAEVQPKQPQDEHGAADGNTSANNSASESDDDKAAAAAAAAAEREAREEIRKKKIITSALETLNSCLTISKSMINAAVAGMSGGTKKGEEQIRAAISHGSCTFINTHADLKHFEVAQKFSNLKLYQQCGVHWLSLLHSVEHANGILADEMGLGKTAQASVFLSYLYNIDKSVMTNDFITRLKDESVGGKRSTLILVPSSVLDNWCTELRNWAPNLRKHIVKYHGAPSVRFKIACDVLEDIRKGSFVILVSTMATVSSKEDIRLLRGLKEFEYMLVDEAHALKNSETIAYRRLNGSFNIRHRLLLTGTPIQNSQSELGNLLQFAMPDTFDQSKITTAIKYLITHYDEAVSEFPALAELVETWEIEAFKKLMLLEAPRTPKPRGRKPKKVAEGHPATDADFKDDKGGNNEPVNEGEQGDLGCVEPTPIKVENTSPKQVMGEDDCSPIKRKEINHPSEAPIAAMQGSSTDGLSVPEDSISNHIMAQSSSQDDKVLDMKIDINREMTGESVNTCGHNNIKNEQPITEVQGGTSDTEEKQDTIDVSIRVLQRLIAPFILRRKKKTVMHELPAKNMYVVKCKMTGIQLELYMKEVEWKVEQNRDVLVNKYKVSESEVHNMCVGKSKNLDLTRRDDFFVKSLIFRMRRICNHPLLVPGSFYKEELLKKLIKYYATKVEGFKENPYDRVEKEIRGWSDFEIHRSLQSLLSVEARLERYLIPKEEFMKSAKVVELFNIIDRVRQGKRKALVFSQFTMYLDLLQECLDLNMPQVRYLRLDGGYNPSTRTDVVEQFSSDENVTLMLISTKAGGTGLNLTAASTVVLMDQDWNPHNDAQAEDRCHRIGQTEPVDVYKLLCEGSIEEYVMECCQRKLKLDDAFSGTVSSEHE